MQIKKFEIPTLSTFEKEWICPKVVPLYRKLKTGGLNEEIIQEIIQKIIQEIARKTQVSIHSESLRDPHFIETWAAKYLSGLLVCKEQRFEGRYHVFVGRAGHGKTSTLIKCASEIIKSSKGSIGIVTADHTKIGAVEQLKTYTQILNIAFAHLKTPKDWETINRNQRFSQLDHILVDFPPFQSKEKISYFVDRLPPKPRERRVHYVQSVMWRELEIDHSLQTSFHLGLSDIILTGLDELTQHGVIVNIQRKHQLPLHSFGIGHGIPEDLEPATKKKIIDLILRPEEKNKEEIKNQERGTREAQWV